MSELEALFVFATAIYVCECIHWIRKESVAFWSPWTRSFRWIAAADLPGNEEHGILMSMPLPPLGTVFLSQPLPVSLSEDGVLGHVAYAPNPGLRPAQTAAYAAFESLAAVAVEQREVRVDGRVLVRTNSAEHAREIADLVRRLCALPRAERSREIGRALERSLDTERVRERVDLFRRSTLGLRIACNALTVHVFGVTPGVIFAWGFTTTWPLLLGGFVVAWLACAALTWRAHRALHPERRRERWGRTLTALVSPLGAARACDALARDLLCARHPLAVARVLCSAAAFQRSAERVLRDLHHPIEPACPVPGAPERRTEAEWRERITASIERFVERSGVATAALLAEPRRDSEESAAYCPRCTRQYVVPDVRCYPCFDLATVPFRGARAGSAAG